MAKCSKCGQEKNKEDFYYPNSYLCKDCMKEYSKIYYEEHKEQRKEYNRKNRETLLLKKRKHYEDNKEEYRIKRKEYYSKNKEKIRNKIKEFYYSTEEGRLRRKEILKRYALKCKERKKEKGLF